MRSSGISRIAFAAFVLAAFVALTLLAPQGVLFSAPLGESRVIESVCGDVQY